MHPAPPLPPADLQGLRERAAAALLDLIEAMPGTLPNLAQVARQMDVAPTVLGPLYADSAALVAQMAAQASATLSDTCLRSVVKVDPDQPLAQFHALGRAYLEWALAHPRLFRLLTDRRYCDLAGDPVLSRESRAMSEAMRRILHRAQDLGQVSATADIDLMILSGRAFAYGLARSHVDGRVPTFYGREAPASVLMAAMDGYIRATAIAARAGIEPQPSRSEA